MFIIIKMPPRRRSVYGYKPRTYVSMYRRRRALAAFVAAAKARNPRRFVRRIAAVRQQRAYRYRRSFRANITRRGYHHKRLFRRAQGRK